MWAVAQQGILPGFFADHHFPGFGVPTLKAVGTGKHGFVKWGEVTSPLLSNSTAYSKITWKDLNYLHIKGTIFVTVVLVQGGKTSLLYFISSSLLFSSWLGEYHKACSLNTTFISI